MTKLDTRIRKVFDAPDPVGLDEVKNRASRPRRRTPSLSHTTSRRVLAAAAVVALIAASAAVTVAARHRASHVEVTVGGLGASGTKPGPATALGGTTHNLPSTFLTGRSSAATVWTGTEMLIWGGSGQGGAPHADGASYTPATGKWQELPKSPLRARADPFYAWTGQELIIWGGGTNVGQRQVFVADGAAYNPATRTWRMVPAPPRSLGTGTSEVWTGSEMIIVSANQRANVAAAYSPNSNRWHVITAPPAAPTNAAPNTPDAVWTGHQAVFLMQDNDNFRNGQFLAVYNPTRNTWSKTASGHIPNGSVPYLVWDGRDVILLGTSAWNPATNKWKTLPSSPTADVSNLYSGQNVIWTGKLILLWGPTRQPVAFDPSSDQWATFNGGAHPYRNFAQVVWTGHALLGWGGQYTNNANREYDTGIAYQPAPAAA